MNTEIKGLPVNILRSDYDCSINKLYGKKDAILITDNCKLFTASEKTPALRIVKRFLSGRDYFHVEPAEGGFFAFGGSFVYSSDSRFTFDYPLPLHDRQMDLEK